jgi:hypothetical protein
MTQRVKWALVLLCALCALPVAASQVRQMTWDDLRPVVEFEDPFAKLTTGQLQNLSIVARVREMKAADREVGEMSQREAVEAEAALVKEGVDIDGLLARRAEIRNLRKKRATAVVGELDGTKIRMPGYVLPIEYAGTKVTEFLLVPWVGACIHTPPPPPNQIVHVVVDESQARESGGMFEPVWVTGDMYTKAAVRNLFLKDGSDDISIGYTLTAILVEAYEKPE